MTRVVSLIFSDVIIIGAGAAGLMAAATAGYRGRSVTVLDMGHKTLSSLLIVMA